jgi:putative nucleotidyltransferase with HDIG domain
MGFAAVKNLAMTTSVFGAYTSTGEAQFNRQEFWRHSICVGIATDVVFQKTRSNATPLFQKDQLHLCGLLHDIGKILLEKNFPEEFMEAMRCARDESISLIVAERRIYETDHAEVGAWLAKRWNMSDEIIETILKHHDPETADEQFRHLVRLCHTANHICNLEHLGDGGDTAVSQFYIEVWRKLGLKVKDIESIVAEVNEQSKESEILMAFVS